MTLHLPKEDEKEERPSCCGGGVKQETHHDENRPADSDTNSALEELKKEILASINKEKRLPLAWGSLTVSVVLGLLAVTSVVQTIQSASLYNKLKSGEFQPTAVTASAPAQSLPTQVGGC